MKISNISSNFPSMYCRVLDSEGKAAYVYTFYDDNLPKECQFSGSPYFYLVFDVI